MRNSDKVFVVLASLALIPAAVTSAPDTSSVITVPGGRIDVHFEDGPTFILPHQALLDWVLAAANAVTAYYGRFPVSHVDIEITPEEGRGVHDGTTYGYRGGLITVSVGEEATQSNLDNDWVMTHEMVHLAFPRLDASHKWLEEGLATYVEPLGRVRTGNLTPQRVWGDLIEGLPKGLPQPGDRGLDITHTWGRTYWGGALFCLEADIEILERTHGQKGLQDALRGILNAGGTIRGEWDIEKALRMGDKAIGVPVLEELYDHWRASPVPVNLPALWKQLGVEKQGDQVIFDDNAPLAWVRHKITGKF